MTGSSALLSLMTGDPTCSPVWHAVPKRAITVNRRRSHMRRRYTLRAGESRDTRWALAVGIGALGSLGRPGIDLWPCFLVSLTVLAYSVIQATSWRRALLLAGGWQLGILPCYLLGLHSWG